MAPRVRDTLFGEMVIRAGLCTNTQIGEALDVQEEYRRKGEDAPKLGEVLTEQSHLTKEQLDALLRGKYTRQEGRFGEVAVSLSLCFSEDISRAVSRQEELKSEQAPHQRIGELLVADSALEKHHVGAILQAMGLKEESCPFCGENVTVGRDDEQARCTECDKPMSGEEEEQPAPLPEAPDAQPEEVSRIAQAVEEGRAPEILKARPPKATLVVEDGPEASANSAEFAGYNILARLGTNASGGLYLASKGDEGKLVTLKIFSGTLSKDKEFARSFKSAAKDGVILKHEGINRVVDVGRDRGRVYCASEYVKGRSLRYLLEKQGKFKVPLALNLARQIAEALACAHEQGVVHGDLKPSNVIVGSDFRVKIANFGVVTNPIHNLLAVSKMSGSAPIYAAPELAARNAMPSARSDIFSLGATLYHMIAGKPPIEGSSPLQTLLRVAEEEIKPPSALIKGVPADVDKVVMAMLAIEPKERHSEMNGVVEDLTALGADKVPTPAPKPAQTEAGASPAPELSPEASAAAANRRRQLVVSLVVAAVVGLLFVGVALGLVMVAPSLERYPIPEITRLKPPAADAPVLKDQDNKKKPKAKPKAKPKKKPRAPIGGY
jgi:Protein kinase domain